MDALIALLEEIPDDSDWHVRLGECDFILRNFEIVDPSIYNRGDLILADVVKNISGPSAITSRNKIEFEVQQVIFVKSVDGTITTYEKGEQQWPPAT